MNVNKQLNNLMKSAFVCNFSFHFQRLISRWNEQKRANAGTAARSTATGCDTFGNVPGPSGTLGLFRRVAAPEMHMVSKKESAQSNNGVENLTK